MPLAGKYLKYSPEITLEIFTLVWNKLIENGWSSINVKSLYNQFIGNWNYIVDHNGKQFYSSVTNREFKEATVQEILGYDPFVNKESIPEYVECIEGYGDQFTKGKIYKISTTFISDYQYHTESDDGGLPNGWSKNKFKSSTKEAFDAQNKPKSIEKWSVGSYGVVINSTNKRFPIGFIDEIILAISHKKVEFKNYNSYDPGNLEYSHGLEFKWFATKSEAEEFSKTLVEPVKHGNGILDATEVKQPLKQAVHCKTQEEWDFVTEKLGYEWSEYSEWSCYKNNTCINLNEVGFGTAGVAYKGYQILSFQEWCQQSGYKMEKKVKFKVGDFIMALTPEETSGCSLKKTVYKISDIYSEYCTVESTTTGNQIYFKDIRHATPEEINNHLISIGRIPAGEPLNNGIEPNKDGIFRYNSTTGNFWTGLTPTNHLGAIYQGDIMDKPVKPKMTLSINDEELPMVSIIKTNSIKQLLSND